ncbi:carboxypeptidase S [Crepidotus variabilis]|uniref:Carboxypeptidase S n=1 Tax=Crepidotus variabilis TaxID=179855 RepID=A0A9P6JS17_9AGAR|nr:carboxypeptidase S [Crepidotus variabilis]
MDSEAEKAQSLASENQTTHIEPSGRRLHHWPRAPLAWRSKLLALVAMCAGYALLEGLSSVAPTSKDTESWIPLKDVIDMEYLVGNKSFCPQVDPLVPEQNKALWRSLEGYFGGDPFKQKAINWLGGAVRVPTESFDGMGPVGQDPRWEVFGPFHEYILAGFPFVHTTLIQTKVNTYGLVYEWQGSDPSLKPILLAAHQDVVPVEPLTVGKWTHPPYSGYFDGENIWGRGSVDDKGGLIGILAAVETLIASGFQPTRTVVLTFGFDEEASGFEGAGHLGPHLEAKYGKDGIAMIIDEGSGFIERFGSVVAVPAIAEKGYMNVLVKVSANGGHSSVPPSHTSIGILSALLVHFEKHPTPVEITRKEPVYATFQCLAEHSKSMPSSLRKVVRKSASSKAALQDLDKFIRKDNEISSLVRNTQAIDIIQGGVKSNALPEEAWAVVNHRVAVVSSLKEVQERDAALLRKLARKFNLAYEAFGNTITKASASTSGSLVISDWQGTALDVAPVTPYGKDAAPYQLLAGTIKATYNAHRGISEGEGKSIIVAPGIMSGNTDTRFYWNLSQHIFRYNHGNGGNGSIENEKAGLGGIHTVNENIQVDAFVEMIRFFAAIILNADETKTF